MIDTGLWVLAFAAGGLFIYHVFNTLYVAGIIS
jgi:hypothetical protein